MKLRLAFGHECNRRKVGNLIKTCENAVRGGKAAQDEIDVQDENVVEDENTAQGGSGSSEQVADKLVIKHPETLESQSGDHSGDASVAKHSSGDEKLYLDRTRFPVPYKMRHYRKKKKTIYPKKVTRATIYPRKDKKERFTFFRPIGPTPEIFSTVSDHSS
ncbi:unnamed protein product [Chrysodeixis includens]|uniref:Uncharacterized protein n=1 Tax=Chrysodeixis includens TaxID=689277 RepID=A0A9N8Q1A0_CHRIL|nr:unnamed protein product [Chrysodeixis includens]